MTFCPGKRGPSVFGAPWARDLRLDMEIIADWRPDLVVTLMEKHELRDLEVPHLGEEVARHKIDWLHLPIRDLGIPDARFERRWVYFGHLLRSRLNAGGRVLLHCRGGRGRTGLIAAQLLMEFGATHAEALKRVRAVRLGAVETPAQEGYLAAYHPAAQDIGHADRLLGCLFGGAVGDAFGYAVEFDRVPTIQARFGPAGMTEPVLNNGRLLVSDDTQMTMFTAEGLIAAFRAGEVDHANIVRSFRAAYVDWLATQQGRFAGGTAGGLLADAALWAARAPGNTCLSALIGGGQGTPETPINNSKGCGGVMRVAPIGLLRQFDSDTAFDLGMRAAAVTHGHASGYLSAGAGAALIRELIADKTIAESVKTVGQRLITEANHGEVLDAMEQAITLAGRRLVDHPSSIRKLGGGWVGEEALGIALYAVTVGTSFREAIVIAANHDGDSDSTASIAGQLWGAMHGLPGLPIAWVTKLDVFDALCRAAAGLLEIDSARSMEVT
jgi:ADP-ribosylglycohydrolase/protein-tyrosine phosphatase